MSIGICKHCQSFRTKISSAYPTDYFCLDCKDGGSLDSLKPIDHLKFSDLKNFPINADGVIHGEPGSGPSAIINYLLTKKFNEKLEKSEEYEISISDNGLCDYDEGNL